jgi:hypothetical protein
MEYLTTNELKPFLAVEGHLQGQMVQKAFGFPYG